MLQRRSKPVKGSVPVFLASVGALALDGSAALLGVVLVGEPVSFDGEVPVLGVGVGGVVVVLGVLGVWP